MNTVMDSINPIEYACAIVSIKDLETLQIFHECTAPEHTLG